MIFKSIDYEKYSINNFTNKKSIEKYKQNHLFLCEITKKIYLK